MKAPAGALVSCMRQDVQQLTSTLRQTACWLREVAAQPPVADTARVEDLLNAAGELERVAASRRIHRHRRKGGSYRAGAMRR